MNNNAVSKKRLLKCLDDEVVCYQGLQDERSKTIVEYHKSLNDEIKTGRFDIKQKKNYSYLKNTDVEIHRSDFEFNVGKAARVLEVKEDALRVFVLENGEEFWTDVDSVYYE